MPSRTPTILLMLCLVVGPLCLGSYYGDWRWPLIYLSCAAGLSLSLWPMEKSAGRGKVTAWVLAVMLTGLLLQGLWMWWNAKYEFTREPTIHSGWIPWSLVPLEVPYPEWPGAKAKNEAWDRLTYIIPALMLVWGVARLVSRRPAAIRWVSMTVFFTGLTVALLGLIFRWTAAEGPFWSEDLISSKYMPGGFSLFFGTYRSPGIASAYLNMSMVLGLSLALRHLCRMMQKGRGLGTSVMYLLGSIIIFNAVMAAGSKAGMALAGASIVLWLLMNGRVLWSLICGATTLLPNSTVVERAVAGLAMLLIVVLTGLSWAETTVVRWQQAMEGGFGTLEERTKTNKGMMNMIQDAEWGALGHGLGAFYPMFPYHCIGMDIRVTYFYAHNDHLQTLVEWGWLGFSAFALVIGGACAILLWNSLSHGTGRALGRKGKIMQRGVFIAIFICLLHATVDFPFQIESIAITVAVLVGVGWGSAGYLRGK